jgi:hypothetical protein
MEKPIIKDLPNKELGSMITGSAAILFTLGCIYGHHHLVSAKTQKLETGSKSKMDGRMEAH